VRQLALATLLIALLATPAAAQAPPAAPARDPGQVSQITMEISNQIYSPFCPGKTLVMCPSPGAAEVRQRIQNMAREHNIAIVAGSTAWRHETSGKLRNRSWMLWPGR
jgi:cytochrome c-type biogenesis protein CcmH/NrfF